MLNGDDRAQAIYNAVSGQPLFGKLTDAEKAAFKASLSTVFGADANYLKAAVQVNPGSINGAGLPVQVTPASGTGTLLAPGVVSGVGTIS